MSRAALIPPRVLFPSSRLHQQRGSSPGDPAQWFAIVHAAWSQLSANERVQFESKARSEAVAFEVSKLVRLQHVFLRS
jgi:hypothetical protein